MNASILATLGGYQELVLAGGEWTGLILSATSALLAIAVGVSLAKGVTAEAAGTPTMQHIGGLIADGAQTYLRRPFRTVGVIAGVGPAILIGTVVHSERRAPIVSTR